MNVFENVALLVVITVFCTVVVICIIVFIVGMLSTWFDIQLCINDIHGYIDRFRPNAHGDTLTSQNLMDRSMQSGRYADEATI